MGLMDQKADQKAGFCKKAALQCLHLLSRTLLECSFDVRGGSVSVSPSGSQFGVLSSFGPTRAGLQNHPGFS